MLLHADRLGRLTSSYTTENGVIVEQKESTFDAKGRDLKYTYVGDYSYSRDYKYYDETGLLGSVTQDYNGEHEIMSVLSYANLGRVRFRIYAGNYNGRVSYTYQTDNSDTNRIISNMTSMRYTFGGKQTFADYSYDNIGNIKHAEYRYDSVPYTFVDYNYDRYNQLKKEVHSPLSMGIDLRSAEYAYDEFGNITDVTRTDSSGKVTKNRYVYSDKTGWQDLLTSYNGHTITYDEIGNPLSYYNGKNYSFEWEAGRRLYRSASGGNSITYYYNKDGIRTKKSVSGKYTDRYILDGDRVIGMERTKSGSSVKDVYHFMYDEMGNIWLALCYIGGSTTPVRYYYRTNAQGDVKQIVDKDNNVIAYYAYDAWGKPLAILDGNNSEITDSTHFAIVNPFRYRGYIYDSETGLYYLQSRYYDPIVRRFINADEQINQSGNISGFNLFAYADNSPSTAIDPSGTSAVGLMEIVSRIAYYCSNPEKLLVHTMVLSIILIGSGYLYSNGYELSNYMYLRAFFGKGGRLPRGIKEKLVERLKESQIMNAKLQEIADRGCQYIKEQGSIEFKSSGGNDADVDLYYSLQHAWYAVKGHMFKGEWHLTVNIADRYDFDTIRLSGENAFANSANNMGFFFADCGLHCSIQYFCYI